MATRNETPTSQLRKTERKLATARRRLARIQDERRRVAYMRPIYRMMNLIGGVAMRHFERKESGE